MLQKHTCLIVGLNLIADKSIYGNQSKDFWPSGQKFHTTKAFCYGQQ